jgi:hypothetical protein
VLQKITRRFLADENFEPDMFGATMAVFAKDLSRENNCGSGLNDAVEPHLK